MKKLFIFLSGVLVGSLATGITARFVYKKKLDETCDGIRSYYKNKLLKANEVVDVKSTEETKVDAASEKPKTTSVYEVSNTIHPDVAKTLEEYRNYSKTASRYSTADKEADDTAKVFKILSGREYDTLLHDPKVKKENLTYYIYDEVLADDDDTSYDINTTIGPNAFHELEDEAVSELYVYNLTKNTVYDVVKIDGAYSDVVGERYDDDYE